MFALELLILVAMMLLNGVLAMSELALVSSRRARVQSLARGGDRGARAALRLMEDPGRFLATVQIGITLVGIAAGAYGGATLSVRIAPWLNAIPSIAPNGDTVAIVLVVALTTYLSLVVGELVPKRVALFDPERVASRIARPMRVLSRVAAPAVWLLKGSTDLALRILGLHGEPATRVSEEEVRALVAEGTRAGLFAPQEKEMIEGVLRFADRNVRAIMTPRRQVVWADCDETLQAIVDKIANTPFTRMPVCEGTLDRVVGVVDASALLKPALSREDFDLRALMTPPPTVPESMPVLRLLEQFRRGRTHFAVVLDEHGAVEGVVTLTDVLEAIAGDFPEPGEPDEPATVMRGDGSWLVDAGMAVDEFADKFALQGLAGRGYRSVAGFVMDRLGRLPKEGDRCDIPGASIEVVDMDGRRIDKVLVRLSDPAADPGEPPSDA